MADRPFARGDFVSALVLVALGGAVVAGSLAMPRYEQLNVNPFSVPGLVPGLIGAVILLLGLVLLVRAVRQGGYRLSGGPGVPIGALLVGREGAANLLLLVALTLGYGAVLVGLLPFWLATAVFVLAFILLFERDLPGTARQRWGRAAFALAEALIVAFAVSYVFEEVFLVRLP